MEFLMQILEPRSRRGVIMRAIFFVALITCTNMGFVQIAGLPTAGASWWYFFLQALMVGGPFVVFFFIVMMFQVRLQRQLSLSSRKDWLTGLNNRRTFLDLAERRHRQFRMGILLLLDADNFKHINDTYGHQAGDNCLKSIAYMLQRNLRDGDVIGRIGGEEFAILLSNTTLDQARVIGERLTHPIPFQAGPEHPHLTVTLSVGAVATSPDVPLEALFIHADRALYKAKAQGRARLIFDTGPPQQIAV
jgi:diguanylate cyclase